MVFDKRPMILGTKEYAMNDIEYMPQLFTYYSEEPLPNEGCIKRWFIDAIA